jgi:hypothetical protein
MRMRTKHYQKEDKEKNLLKKQRQFDEADPLVVVELVQRRTRQNAMMLLISSYAFFSRQN